MAKTDRVKWEFADDIAQEIFLEFADEVEKSMHEIRNVAIDNAPTVKGNLAERIHAGAKVLKRGIQGKVWTNSGYAAPVELGSGLWGPKKDYIYPKTKKFLSWIGTKSGKRIFARRVKGHPPQPFLKPAIDQTIPRMLKRMKNIVKRVGLGK